MAAGAGAGALAAPALRPILEKSLCARLMVVRCWAALLAATVLILLSSRSSSLTRPMG